MVVKYFTYLKHAAALDRLRVRLNVILFLRLLLATRHRKPQSTTSQNAIPRIHCGAAAVFVMTECIHYCIMTFYVTFCYSFARAVAAKCLSRPKWDQRRATPNKRIHKQKSYKYCVWCMVVVGRVCIVMFSNHVTWTVRIIRAH